MAKKAEMQTEEQKEWASEIRRRRRFRSKLKTLGENKPKGMTANWKASKIKAAKPGRKPKFLVK